MQRTRSSIAFSLPFFAVLFSLLLGGAVTTFISLSVGQSTRQHVDQLGNILAAELASSSLQALIHDDKLSLQVEVAETGELPGVISARVEDSQQEILSRSGALQTELQNRTFTAPIFFDGKKNGAAIVELDNQYYAQPYQSLLRNTLLFWALLSLAFIALTVRTAAQWSDRLQQLTSKLPSETAADNNHGKSEIDLLEESLTPLLNNSAEQHQQTDQPVEFQSVLSLSFRNLTRLETQLSEDNYNTIINCLDQAINFVLNLYAGTRLNLHDQTLNLCFPGHNAEDDHPVRALYAAQAILQLFDNLQASKGLNLDCAIAITSSDVSSPQDYLRSALSTEKQLHRAMALLKAASVKETLLDQATGTHPALDHIALLEPLNPEQAMFRCEGLEETAETLVNRQLAFFDPQQAV